MQKIADLLQVDEFHLFDQSGLLYNGSQPKYFGYRFDSGEQMQAFLPMLNDKSIVIAQDVTPNTAKKKLMQYTAVWMENGENIVQISMEPQRLLEAMRQTELSYIFSTVTPEEGTTIYVIDKESLQISGSTKTEYLGLTAAYMSALSLIMILAITACLNHYIISGINAINSKLRRITTDVGFGQFKTH